MWFFKVGFAIKNVRGFFVPTHAPTKLFRQKEGQRKIVNTATRIPVARSFAVEGVNLVIYTKNQFVIGKRETKSVTWERQKGRKNG
jgi:hypothetical protein|tara:strand:+ start:787 stop:1044 length:258 start_codon:yes stop_codon:yes gene_type:complete